MKRISLITKQSEAHTSSRINNSLKCFEWTWLQIRICIRPILRSVSHLLLVSCALRSRFSIFLETWRVRSKSLQGLSMLNQTICKTHQMQFENYAPGNGCWAMPLDSQAFKFLRINMSAVPAYYAQIQIEFRILRNRRGGGDDGGTCVWVLKIVLMVKGHQSNDSRYDSMIVGRESSFRTIFKLAVHKRACLQWKLWKM